ncbi:hypothetical protein [Paenibacillus phytorum]|uniref:hypothetical protein n=1 Tax=Paenibacillus phytorum TaxID=2654977 RepID=UPI001C100097|nr:hypothetical protein [Paenibacillus phytorum]
MKMAFVLFDGMTTLDFAGFFEAITWMGILGAKENVTWDFCSNKEEITDDRGLIVKIKHVYPIYRFMISCLYLADLQREALDSTLPSSLGSKPQVM